ncbi:MAG: hypothetical protein H2060_05880 [Azoarcus sp.]|nr:hypothetical protein [Azoarcus sp.]
MTGRLVLLCIWLLACVAGAASAQVRTVFDGCVDARGAPVRSVEDASIDAAFSTRIEDGRPVIRYNASQPPGASEAVRLFFYAHECARLGLGLAPDALRTVGDAWRADCRALDTLLQSSLIRRADVPRLQADLDALSDAARERLLGPRRDIDLPACARAGIARPLALPASRAPGQDRWNTCVHACADRLLACQRASCGGLDCPSCLPAHESCVAACDTAAR